MTTLQTVFAKAKADDRAALVGYLPAGFPTKDGAIAAATAMVEAGCDVIEIGLPYSDPLMDGPTIQDAVHRALSNGTRIADVLRTVEGVAKTGAATLVMTYWNPIDRYGAERFARDLASAGGVGTITPDLTPEEAGPWREASAAAGIDTVFLVAPSSTDERIKAVVECCTGFVYAASLMGVTGARESVSSSAQGLVERTRAHTDLPVCVGLGVGNGRQAAEVAAYADGVIVGSAFIRRLLDAADEASGLAAVRELGAELAAGVRG
ncbi:tryptophan synthase subunit alpha [Planomonospora sp. ID91781]|uniref:Tryptophan synthase alpha chain n=3 Tax=Planomonospora TaxID=1998 RepID=A0A171B828_9ACTN|nr:MULTISPECIES: tryptophan synthase subunit alpha [Planomonospora]MBG0822114.1 tryptophan synthase subunit alpha [Planomonospora sp. ID91781]GAT64762.1 tryptophan synthase subunit alpha [Planomonospora sphaerica]GGK48291.1 tryptophan synthase alpha chain [Planomonospora parontospora]GII06697.1 tryptophan synthase alpha chain [Planomonospora parontospora subsp. parontospora]